MMLLAACLLALAAGGAPAEAGAFEMGRHRFDPGGKVKAARAHDVDGDGRRDVVLVVESAGGKSTHVLLLRAPAGGLSTWCRR